MPRSHTFAIEDAAALKALAAGSLAMRFAPLVRLVDGRICAVLARLAALGVSGGWTMSPNTLRRELSSTLRDRVSDSAMTASLAAAVRWRRGEHRDWPVAVEAHARDLDRPEFALRVLSAARRSGVAPAAIRIDCPTPLSRKELLGWGLTIHTLREVGIRFTVRVSATNIALLERLHPTPFDEIRLVGGVVARLAQSSRRSDLPALSDLLLLAESTGTPLSAENVDDSATAASLRELGFVAASGSYFGQFTGEARLRALDEESIRARARQAGRDSQTSRDDDRTAQPA